mgnify:CR=1 FL=1
MKTNTKRFAGFLLTLVMIVAMFTMMSVSASAEEAGSADILGTYVNLGGDIELNYAVQLDEGVDIQDVKLRTVFLGVEKYLTATESDFNGVYYTFTLEGINPQCLGDEIDAELYIGDKKVDELLDFSVEDNMLLLKADSKLTDDEINLIEALLAYGKASEAYTGHTSMTGSYAISSYEPLTYEANISDSSSVVSVQSANVRFGTTTYLMFTFTFDNDTTPFDLAGNVTIDGKIATTYMADNTCVAISAPISPENFHKDVAVNYNDELNFTFSVNDYCYIVTKEDSTASESMKTLAKALYNYGIYAHIVSGEHIGGDGTATCEHGKICSVCGEYYGETLEHSYTYTANDDDNTITAACVNGCGHSQTIELKAPENAIYNGNKIEATVTGADGITYSLTYNADPVNAGTYTATLTVGDKSVSVDFSIAKATPTYEVPTGLTATYGDTLAKVELPTGWAWNDAETTSVGNAGTRTFKALYNPDSNNYNTVEADVTVEVAKADPEYTVPTGLTATYSDTLADVELPAGWTWKDAETTSVGNAGTRTFKAVFTPADTVNYNTVEADVTIEVAKAEIDGSTLINPEFAKGLIYNGTAQALVTKTGSVDGGYIVYSLSIDGEYTTTIPVATEAGNYRVYWTIECDENHYVDGTPGSSRVTIAAKDASNATVTLDDTSVQFDGTAKTPGVTSVVVNGKTLNAETDYEVSYSNNTYVGTATVTITFKGNYTGTATATFEIIQDPKTGEFDGEWVQM